VNLVDVVELVEGVAVSKGHINDPMVNHGTQSSDNSGLFSSSWACSGDEEASVFGSECALAPDMPGGIPEGLFIGSSVPKLTIGAKKAG
jgi:hypothetical protein